MCEKALHHGFLNHVTVCNELYSANQGAHPNLSPCTGKIRDVDVDAVGGQRVAQHTQWPYSNLRAKEVVTSLLSFTTTTDDFLIWKYYCRCLLVVFSPSRKSLCRKNILLNLNSNLVVWFWAGFTSKRTQGVPLASNIKSLETSVYFQRTLPYRTTQIRVSTSYYEGGETKNFCIYPESDQ